MKTLTFYLTTAFAQALSVSAHANVSASTIANINPTDAAFVPEFGTFILFGAGLIGLYFARRRAHTTA